MEMTEQNIRAPRPTLPAEIRAAAPEDWPALLQIHQNALPDSLMARLGPRYALETLYPAATLHEDTLTLAAAGKEGMLGFIMLGSRAWTFNKLLARKKTALLKAMARRPAHIFSIARAVGSSLRRSRFFWEEEPPDNSFHLFLIAVDPRIQQKGFGTTLLEHGLREAETRFNSRFCLVEARTDSAIRFYLKNGFRRIGREIRAGMTYEKLLRTL